MDYRIIKSKRKTVSIQINRNLQITVKAPLYFSDSEIERFVEEKEKWIKRNIEKMKAVRNDYDCFSGEEINALKRKAYEIIPSRVEHFAGIISVKYNRISVKKQVSRWGSCSSKGNLNFNCLLVLVPDKVRDYVIIHELCHLIELNHSDKFRFLVEKYCPDYKECEKWLKNNGYILIDRLEK